MTVPAACLFDGAVSPTALSTTIPIDGAGNVVSSTQTFSINQVICTVSTSVTATSVNGGVKSSTTPGGSFTNGIDCKAKAQFGKAKSNINTATVKGAAGVEQGNTDSMGTAHKGTLIIQMTPTVNTQPLVGGNYSDTLRVVITPD